MSEVDAAPQQELSKASSLRYRILAFVGALILLSLLGSTLSLYRITEVSRLLDTINQVAVPMGRLFAQMQSDVEVFRREAERNLGHTHWKDFNWRPRPVPRWIEDILESQTERLRELVAADAAWMDTEARQQWSHWAASLHASLVEIRAQSAGLYLALEQKDEAKAAQIYQRWSAGIGEWRRQVQWGGVEYERVLKRTFELAESRTDQLRTGLQIVLIVVVLVSLLLLWLGERALRPLNELTRLARDIARRGLRKEDKALVPDAPLSRSDEVSQLTREFHRMATTLLEREKTVETQKKQMQEQNRLLRRMGELNENVLKSIDSLLIVTDLGGRITQCNPMAVQWLQAELDATQSSRPILGSYMGDWERLLAILGATPHEWLERLQRSGEPLKIEPCAVDGRIHGGTLIPLRANLEDEAAHGAILVLDDLTDDIDLQRRLSRAENLAAVGRMSAQVAHEVRNPLHSIGLEAELAADMASALGNIPLKQSLQSILYSVDRLEKITENYLKLSRLSAGEKTRVELGGVLETVLATYASACEAQAVMVDWRRETPGELPVWGDRALLEQVFGNLFRNALQALQGVAGPRIVCTMGLAESGRAWFRIEDNGPGIDPEVRDRLFTPFVTTRSEGTGLGLSFVKKVLEDHGGTIVALERAPGLGAAFELALPMAQAERAETLASRLDEARQEIAPEGLNG